MRHNDLERCSRCRCQQIVAVGCPVSLVQNQQVELSFKELIFLKEYISEAVLFHCHLSKEAESVLQCFFNTSISISI